MTFNEMGFSDWLLVAATVAGPILAVQAQKWIERSRAQEMRRTWIFETLMSTRGARMSLDHVRALNTIDLAFFGRRVAGKAWRNRDEQGVIDAWHNYHAHLSVPENQRARTPQQDAAWGATAEELFVNLLSALATAGRYGFEREQLKSGGYTPQGYQNVDLEQQAVRNGLIQVLSGSRPLPVEVREPTPPPVPGLLGGMPR